MAGPVFDVHATLVNRSDGVVSESSNDNGFLLIPRKTFTTSTGTMTGVTATVMAYNDYSGNDYTAWAEVTITYSDGSSVTRNYRVNYSTKAIIGDFPGTFTYTNERVVRVGPATTIYWVYSYTENNITISDIDMYRYAY